MKPHTPLQRFRVGAHVRELNRKLAVYKDWLFKLMSHPDTTDADIREVQTLVRDMSHKINATNKLLIEAGYNPNLMI